MFCSRLFIALYKAESVPESGGAARAAAAACCLVANIPAFMGHGTCMGHRPHSSIISLCRVELSGAEWSGVDSEIVTIYDHTTQDAVISHQQLG